MIEPSIKQNIFSAYSSKLKDICKKDLAPHLEQIPQGLSGYFLPPLVEQSYSASNSIYLFPDENELKNFSHYIKDQPRTYFLDDQEMTIQSGDYLEDDLFRKNLRILSKILQNYNSGEPYTILSTYNTFLRKLIPQSYLNQEDLKLELEEIISPIELKEKLTDLGYQASITIEEPGQFSHRGEVFDIFSFDGQAYRLNYFDDLIEFIYPIDLSTGRSDKDKTLEKVSITSGLSTFFKKENIYHLSDKLPNYGPSQREKFNRKREIIEKLKNGIEFTGFTNFLPLMFENCDSFMSICQRHKVNIIMNDCEEAKKEFELQKESYLEHRDDVASDDDSDQILGEFSDYWFDFKEIELRFKNKLFVELYGSNHFHNPETILNISPLLIRDEINRFKLENINPDIDHAQNSKQNKINLFYQWLSTYLNQNYQVICYYEKSVDYLKHLSEISLENKFQSKIVYEKGYLAQGFVHKNAKTILVSESDLLGEKLKKVKKSKQSLKHLTQDYFADELMNLKQNDLVVHKQYGVGRYLGLENLNFGNKDQDFLILEYADQDKVYVPVYRLNLLQKYSNESETLKLASLKTSKFQKQKEKITASIKKLAFDLLEIHAKRKLFQGHAFQPPLESYLEFEHSFPYKMTPDQESSTQDVLDDLQKKTPMDRLICGDVGFGKTEVAMRAAFKVVEDGKQVAILVPTTILAFQHNNSFIERFKNFPIQIDFLSRFKSAKESKATKEKVKQGKVDIIIGTHMLLSKDIEFKDLGLVIIDEEHRFGVGHKEKFKTLRQNVDFLTLTATPIPRTMQLSFLGIKDISIIRTAPPSRQAIKTYILRDDRQVVKKALEKELKRDGQAFIVHNRVHDMDQYAAKIQELAPEAKITIAHGQMGERELEKKILEFYRGDTDILLSTTIIESGIDIPNANTMIIDKANNFGLAQLHQLRGRIGRGHRKAYAYFLIPDENKINSTAKKRLKALADYSEVGSGFNLANSDLEIRGSGDILGPEQSGHIGEIGMELYMQLLEDAVNDLKGEKAAKKEDIEINFYLKANIPKKYIDDPGQRLRYYKKLSNSYKNEKLLDLKDELTELFGPIPENLNRLLILLQTRNNLQNLFVLKINLNEKSIQLFFDKAALEKDEENKNKIINYFLSHPKKYKLEPNFSVIYRSKIGLTLEDYLQLSENIAQQILLC
ncbi:transcription-repair coupling factor [Bacteriovoracaceae bacterium]|nr:transcription-repair coupling factor [Bacteriovoracaceae bacterium]